MSFDVYLRSEDGTEHDPCVGPTYNLSPMFTEALGYPFGDLNGMDAKRAMLDCANAWKRMLAHPERYKPLNPPNGWGDYDGALWVFRTLAEACAAHPYSTVVVT